MIDLNTIISSGKQLPEHHPDAPTREAIRRSLLRTAANEGRPTRQWRSNLVVVGVVVGVAAAVTVAWFNLRGADNPEELESGRAVLSPSVDAQLEHRRVITLTDDGTNILDEVVRLSKGRVAVKVKKLRPHERFRVITGDAEVEVRGTAFTVSVKEDKLVRVAVESGLVEVRPWQRGPILLAVGEQWTPSLGKHTLDQYGSSSDNQPQNKADPVRIKNDPVRVKNKAADFPAVPATVNGLNRGDSSAVVSSVQTHEPPTQIRSTTTKVVNKRPKKQAETATHDVRDSSPAKSSNSLPTDTTISSSANTTRTSSPSRPSTKAERAFATGYRALRAGKHGSAAQYFEQAVTFEPQGAIASDARYWRAVSLARGKQHQAARNALREFLRHHPKSARAGSASVMLGWILVEAKELRAARRLFFVGEKDPRRDVANSARKGLQVTEGVK